MKLSGFFFVVIVIFFASCSSQKKVPYNYIENARDTTMNNAIKNYEPVIQKNDLLSIQVYSNSTKPEISDVLYNPPALSGAGTSSTGSSGGSGYLVDINGDIKFPRIGDHSCRGINKRTTGRHDHF